MATSRAQAIVNLAIRLTPELGQKKALEVAIERTACSEQSKELAKKIYKKVLLIARKQGNPLKKEKHSSRKKV